MAEKYKIEACSVQMGEGEGGTGFLRRIFLTDFFLDLDDFRLLRHTV